MIHDLTELFQSPIFWAKVICGLIILALLIKAVSRFAPRWQPVYFGKRVAPQVTVKVAAAPVATSKTVAPKAATKKDGFPFLKVGIWILILGALYFGGPWLLKKAHIHVSGPQVHSSVTSHASETPEQAEDTSASDVQTTEAEEHHVTAPLADGDTDADTWSEWIQIPRIGTHGFDALLGPGPSSGAIRMQCGNGDTAEEAEKNPHEAFPCGTHNWFRVNTVKSETQTEPKDVIYQFKANS